MGGHLSRGARIQNWKAEAAGAGSLQVLFLLLVFPDCFPLKTEQQQQQKTVVNAYFGAARQKSARRPGSSTKAGEDGGRKDGGRKAGRSTGSVAGTRKVRVS